MYGSQSQQEVLGELKSMCVFFFLAIDVESHILWFLFCSIIVEYHRIVLEIK